jgi:CBS domain-containing protein
MSVTFIPTGAGSHVMPAFRDARVSDAMRHGVISCPPETPLVDVARMMASQHVHAVVVTRFANGQEAETGDSAWGIVSDRTLLSAGEGAADMQAGAAATTDFARVIPDDRLEDAARQMMRHHGTHAVVVDPQTHRPTGMLSSLDVAGVIAWGRA